MQDIGFKRQQNGVKSYSSCYLSSASHKTYLLHCSIFDCLLRHVGKRPIYVEFVVLICLKKIQVHVSRSLLSPTPRPFRHGDEARFDAKNCQLLQRQQGAVFYVVFLRCDERFSHVFLEVWSAMCFVHSDKDFVRVWRVFLWCGPVYI